MRSHALSRVVVRVALPTALAGGAIVLAFSLWQGAELHQRTAETRERYADLVGSLVEASLSEAMMAADRPMIQRRLEAVVERRPIRAVWVARKSGEVVHSSDPGLTGQRLVASDATCAACHQRNEPPSERAQTFWVEVPGRPRTLRAVRSIRVEPECRACHQLPVGAQLGVLVTDLDDAALTGDLRAGATRAMWIVAVAALTLLGVLLVAVRVAVNSAESRDEIDEVEHLVQALADDLDDRLCLDRATTRLAATLERSDAPALLLDDHGLVVAANRRALERLAAPPRDATIGQPRAAWDQHRPELVAQAREDGWALADDDAGPLLARLDGRFGPPLGFLELWPEPPLAPGDDGEAGPERPAPTLRGTGGDQATLLYATLIGGELSVESARFRGVLRIDRRLAAARRLISELVRVGDAARAERAQVDLASLVTLAVWELSRQMPELRWHAWPQDGVLAVGARFQLRPMIQRLALAAAERAAEGGDVVLFTQEDGRSGSVYVAAWTPTEPSRSAPRNRSLALAHAIAHVHGGAVERDPAFDITALAAQRDKRAPGSGQGALFVAELARDGGARRVKG
jgi:PAS domain-containing protein